MAPSLLSHRYLRYRKNILGLTLIEIMVTLVLLVLVIMSFAVVYPSGYRLHQKSRMSTEAAQAARSILNELKSLPLTDEAGGMSLAYLASNGFVSSDPVSGGFPRTVLPDGYRLAAEKGISVTLYDLAGGTDPSVYASMAVTLVYQDTHQGDGQPIRMTLVAGKSWNR